MGSKQKSESKIVEMARVIDKRFTSTEEKVAEIIQNKKTISLLELVDELKLSKSTVSRKVRNLEREGLVIKSTVEKKVIVKWIGGIPALESELAGSTQKHVMASILAENYDSMISNAFSLFSILFEDDYWETIMNFQEGLTDTELHQRLGKDISLDSIRRILVTAETHNLIKINRIREVSGNDQIKLFEPLFRIDNVNKEYLQYMTLIRGLASAIQYRMSCEKTPGYSHLYDNILNEDIRLHSKLKEKILSKTTGSESELFNKLLLNYDYVSDLDRLYRKENWIQKLDQAKYLKIETNDRLVVSDGFYK